MENKSKKHKKSGMLSQQD